MKFELTPAPRTGKKINPKVAEILYSREAAALEETRVQAYELISAHSQPSDSHV